MIEDIGNMFANFWQAFTIEHPILGIPFSSIYIGVFVMIFAIKLLYPILGIGGKAVHGIANGISRAGRSVTNEYRRESMTNNRGK